MRRKKEKNLMELYGYYQPYLKKMGAAPLHQWLTIEQLGMNRGAVQAAYKEINQQDLKVTLPEYLALISSRYMLSHLSNAYNTYRFRHHSMLLLVIVAHYPEDSANFLRMVMRHPKLVFDMPEFADFCRVFEKKNEQPPPQKTSLFLATLVADLYFKVELLGFKSLIDALTNSTGVINAETGGIELKQTLS